MRRIRGSLFASLDGVIQAPGGPTEDPSGGFAQGGWLASLFDAEVGEAVDRFFAPPYALLLGRRTYDIFAAFWPYVGGGDEQFDSGGKSPEEAGALDMGEAFTRADKYVLTRGNPDLGWSNSHRLASIEEVAALRQGDGPDLLIQGSSTLYPQLIAARLLDELTVMTFPVLVGSGKRLSGPPDMLAALALAEHRVTDSGTIVATYRPTGQPLTAHSFAPPSTSAREQARQRAIAEDRW